MIEPRYSTINSRANFPRDFQFGNKTSIMISEAPILYIFDVTKAKNRKEDAAEKATTQKIATPS